MSSEGNPRQEAVDENEPSREEAHFERLAQQAREHFANPARERFRRLYGADGPPDWLEFDASEPMALHEMLDRFVLLSDGNFVCDLKHPRVAVPFGLFRGLTASSRLVADPTQPGSRSRLVADDWQQSLARLTVHTRTFAPGRPMICQDPDGNSAVNTWREPPRVEPPQGWTTIAEPFFDHIAFLVPEPEERELLLDYIAHILLCPGELPRFHVAMIAIQQGVGRNWVAECVAAMLPSGTSVLALDIEEMYDSGFNGQLGGKLFAVVDEIHVGGNEQWRHSEKLKSELTATVRHINPKYGRTYKEFNVIRYWFFSNHENALKLTKYDRRIWVIRNPDTPRTAGYYAHLYGLLNDPGFLRAVRHALMQRDLVHFRSLATAPDSIAKQKMIALSKTESVKLLEELMQEHPCDLITGTQLQLAIAEQRPDGHGFTQTHALDASRLQNVLQQCGVVTVGRFRVGPPGKDGKRGKERVYALRDLQKWSVLAEEGGSALRIRVRDILDSPSPQGPSEPQA